MESKACEQSVKRGTGASLLKEVHSLQGTFERILCEEFAYSLYWRSLGGFSIEF